MEDEFIKKLKKILSEFEAGSPCSFKCSHCPLNKIVIDDGWNVEYDLCDIILKIKEIL